MFPIKIARVNYNLSLINSFVCLCASKVNLCECPIMYWSLSVQCRFYKNVALLSGCTHHECLLFLADCDSRVFIEWFWWQLLAEMDKALKRYKCVGVAAPQLGINLRVFAMTFPDEKNFIGSSQEYNIKQMTPYPYTVSCIIMNFI